MIESLNPAARDLARHGVAYAPQIVQAAQKHGVSAQLLAAVAAQETGGPGSNAGSNIVGDGGHGRGLFQIDDRWHAFARDPAAMNPQANADYAAGMISGLLRRYGGDVHKALSAYNAGDPNATGTITPWQDGRRLGYADSVLRHYEQLGGSSQDLAAESPTEQQSVNQLASLTSLMPPSVPPASNLHSYRQLAGNDNAHPESIVDGDDDSSQNEGVL
ncbi:MAG TPA: lytic transglycosylase domain-containing protein [Candidatus Rubrimentiphilum sp.]|nr:lytic transglycosylase domain-containing protein [Candidatus Rubrimentiphilum sp.]